MKKGLQRVRVLPAFSIGLALAISLFFISLPGWGQEENLSLESYKAWNQLAIDGALKLKNKTVVRGPVKKTDQAGRSIPEGEIQDFISFGGEKEGSSVKITRLVGPKGHFWSRFLEREIDQRDLEIFLRTFLLQLQDGSIGNSQVVDDQGLRKSIDLAFLQGLSIPTMKREELWETFEHWLKQTEDRPFSFLKQAVREQIFNGSYPGLAINRESPFFRYTYWVPHFGLPQKYISGVHGQGGDSASWEINVNKVDSYGEFEELLSWFKQYMGGKRQLFESFGHMWMVFPLLDFPPEEHGEYFGHLTELLKLTQLYIVLRSVSGRTGIEFSDFKQVHSDKALRTLDTDRGVIRVLKNDERFPANSLALEIRSGTKNLFGQRFIQRMLAARVSAHDWAPLSNSQEWTLLHDKRKKILLGIGIREENKHWRKFAEDFQISMDKMRDFTKTIRKMTNAAGRPIKAQFLVPLWNWQEAPFLQKKKDFLRELSSRFIDYVVQHPDLTAEELTQAMRQWVHASHITEDLENYLQPHKPMSLSESDLQNSFSQIVPRGPVGATAAPVQAADIHLGIEYTARFPINYTGAFGKGDDDGHRPWFTTLIGYTPKEREFKLLEVMNSLRRNLGFDESIPIERRGGENAHGHGISISYALKDPVDPSREWRVEWDGIGRNYDEKGQVVPGSARGGHIELVTPKFRPTLAEIQAVFKTFRENEAVPSRFSGGGHVNIDLSPFQGRPKAMARFLTLFHQHRGIISLLFQHPARLKSAIPATISPSLAKKLANFKGSENELKQLLYNERYFNIHLGRKSRYLQLDVSAYFQDVIPEQFIHEDFDINNPTVLWRPQFRVNPKVRKMEFRLMDAPRDEAESILQIKLVRALLHQALNGEGPLHGKVQKVNPAFYVQNPTQAFADLDLMVQELEDPSLHEDLQAHLAHSLSDVETFLKCSSYQPLSSKMKDHPPIRDEVWLRAVPPRDPENGLASEKRTWEISPGVYRSPLLPESLEYRDRRLDCTVRALQERAEFLRNKKDERCYSRNWPDEDHERQLEGLIAGYTRICSELREEKSAEVQTPVCQQLQEQSREEQEE